MRRSKLSLPAPIIASWLIKYYLSFALEKYLKRRIDNDENVRKTKTEKISPLLHDFRKESPLKKSLIL